MVSSAASPSRSWRRRISAPSVVARPAASRSSTPSPSSSRAAGRCSSASRSRAFQAGSDRGGSRAVRESKTASCGESPADSSSKRSGFPSGSLDDTLDRLRGEIRAQVAHKRDRLIRVKRGELEVDETRGARDLAGASRAVLAEPDGRQERHTAGKGRENAERLAVHPLQVVQDKRGSSEVLRYESGDRRRFGSRKLAPQRASDGQVGHPVQTPARRPPSAADRAAPWPLATSWSCPYRQGRRGALESAP